MASITKRGSSWRASVYKFGVRRTATFSTKTEARLWAGKTELQLTEEHNTGVSKELFSNVLMRYKNEVSVKKKCHHVERYTIDKIAQSELGSKPISEITTKDIVRWRDSLTGLTNNSVNNKMSLMKHIFGIASSEWGLIANNPAKDIRYEKSDPPRFRRISDDEIEAMLDYLGYSGETPFRTDQNPPARICYSGRVARRTTSKYGQDIARVLIIAIETAMRLGEILNLTWDNINLDARVALLPMTKNGYPRQVPLSQEAINVIRGIRRVNDRLFDIKQATFQSLFTNMKKALGIKDLHFHDTRHEAITRLSKKLNALELARMVGHRNINQLLTYYNESAENIALKL